jgi:hypothetical protein
MSAALAWAEPRSAPPAADPLAVHPDLPAAKAGPGDRAMLERLHPGLTARVPAGDLNDDSIRRMPVAIAASRQP